MDMVFSSVIASFASRSLRAMPSVPSLARALLIAACFSSSVSAESAASISTFLTYCCVRVEAPSCESSSIALRAAARTMPITSTPACS